MGSLPWILLALAGSANAACECGYSLNKTSDHSYAVFTELQENDFLHTAATNLNDVGWQPQEYNVSAEDARGPYGKHMEVSNVVSNPLKDSKAWSGPSVHGGDAGLGLWVRGNHQNGYVEGAELVTRRTDALLGSFRVGMKLSNSSGTCGAFFYYHNNSQEIDMEFLSRQFNDSQGYVNLVLQTPQSVTQGFNAEGTPGYKVQQLPFRPDGMFHEYRFDWTKDRVAFYVDGAFSYEMTQDIPVDAGGIFFNHWSNGDPSWSAGPPDSDTVLTISYVKAYFNSTDTDRSQTAYKQRCPVYDPTKVCAIPAQTSPPDASLGKDSARTYFFSYQQDTTPGQTTFNHSAATMPRVNGLSITVSILVTLFSWSLAW